MCAGNHQLLVPLQRQMHPPRQRCKVCVAAAHLMASIHCQVMVLEDIRYWRKAGVPTDAQNRQQAVNRGATPSARQRCCPHGTTPCMPPHLSLPSSPVCLPLLCCLLFLCVCEPTPSASYYYVMRLYGCLGPAPCVRTCLGLPPPLLLLPPL
jgi:hypothetical protein